MPGYKSNHGSHEKQHPPWKRRLEAKIKATRSEVSQLTQAQRGAMKRPLPQRYRQMPIPEALETAKQRLQALASRLKRYTHENEARRINPHFATQPAKVYSQWQGNNNRADLEAEIIDDEYLFASDDLTEREKNDLDYKRTLRDLAKDYKKAGAKEHEERKNRYYMPEEKRSKEVPQKDLELEETPIELGGEQGRWEEERLKTASLSFGARKEREQGMKIK